jgi:hypothetical protein
MLGKTTESSTGIKRRVSEAICVVTYLRWVRQV